MKTLTVSCNGEDYEDLLRRNSDRLGAKAAEVAVKYLKERFVSTVELKKAHFVDVAEGVENITAKLTAELSEGVVDVGLIGIAENGHIPFNDSYDGLLATLACMAGEESIMWGRTVMLEEYGI